MNNTSAKNFIWTILGLAVLIILVVLFVRWGRGGVPDTGQNATSTTDTTSWLTSADEARGINFKYPGAFNTKYIKAFDWPPQVAVIDGPLQCTPAGNETDRAGKTTKETIGGEEYCVTKIVEGAAGSTYTQYAYAREMEDGRVAILTFSTRAPECASYSDPQRTECQNEVASFKLGEIIDRIFGTLNVGEANLDYQKG